MKLFSLAFLLAFYSLTSPALPAPTPQPEKQTKKTAKNSPAPQKKMKTLSLPPSSASVHHFPNGLTAIIEVDRNAPVASVQAWCATGSIHEDRWLGAGLSHILEHMLFKGTTSRKGGEIAKTVQDQGGYINAYTSFDRTVFYIDVPSSGAMEALDILCDAMTNSTLPEEEYAKEQEVIRREFAMGFDDPGRQGIQLLLKTLYPSAPYGIPVIGHLDVYNSLTRQDVLDYYHSRYTPANLTFIIVGDVDEKAVLAQLEKAFASSPRKKNPPILVPEEPSQLARRDAHEEFPTELSRLYMAWRVPGMDDPDAPALSVLASILGEGRSSILNQEIREKKNLAHSISAALYPTRNESVFFVAAVCDPKNRTAVEKETLASIEKIKKDGVSASQVEKTRKILLADLLSSRTTMSGKASVIGSNWMQDHSLDLGRDFLDAVASTTPAQVQAVAARYLKDTKLTSTSLNPIGSLAKTEDSENASQKSPIQKLTLPNGLTILVREDKRLPLVSLSAAFRAGALEEPENLRGITSLMSKLLIKGTASRTAEQIAETLENEGGSIHQTGGNNSFIVSVDVMSQDLPTGFELLADVLQNPSFPEKEIELERTSQLAGIKAQEDSIIAVALNLLREKMFGAHPYATPSIGTEKTVSQITKNDLAAFHKKLAAGNNGVVSIFGDVDAKTVFSLAEKYLSPLPSGEQATKNPPSPSPLTASTFAEKEIDKQQAVLLVAYQGTDILSPDAVALDVISSASNDLGSRFFDRIREEMGLAYFIGATKFNGFVPGYFAFYVGTDPAKIGEVKTVFHDEINKLASLGLTPEEFARAKKKLAGSIAIQNQSNSSYADTATVNELVGLGYAYSDNYPALLEALTLEQVNEVARRYFSGQPCVEAIVHPPATK